MQMSLAEALFGIGIAVFGTGLYFLIEAKNKKDKKWYGWALFFVGIVIMLIPVGTYFVEKTAAAPSASTQQQNTVNGSNNNAGNINQSGDHNTAVVGNDNKIGNTYNVNRGSSFTLDRLRPARRPAPPSPDPDCPIGDGIKRGAVIIYMGKMVGYSTHFPVVLVSVKGHDLLTVDKDKLGHLSFSGEVFNEHDDAVVVIHNNKATVSDEAFQVEESQDKSALTVTVKHLNEKVLDIEYVNQHALKISGHFRYQGADVRFTENGNQATSGNSGMSSNTGCFVEPRVIFDL